MASTPTWNSFAAGEVRFQARLKREAVRELSHTEVGFVRVLPHLIVNFRHAVSKFHEWAMPR